jgi:lambda repressor-like predicted transcriptional regulator
MSTSPSAQYRSGTWASFFPAEPAHEALAVAARRVDGDLKLLAEVLRIDRSTLYRLLQRSRLRYDAADSIAVALGRHPVELWSNWFDSPYTEGNA